MTGHYNNSCYISQLEHEIRHTLITYLWLAVLVNQSLHTTTAMPINTWNFFRAVSVGSDHASWLSQNPQVEEGRIGGNKEFDPDVTDQYQYEVTSA